MELMLSLPISNVKHTIKPDITWCIAFLFNAFSSFPNPYAAHPLTTTIYTSLLFPSPQQLSWVVPHLIEWTLSQSTPTTNNLNHLPGKSDKTVSMAPSTVTLTSYHPNFHINELNARNNILLETIAIKLTESISF